MPDSRKSVVKFDTRDHDEKLISNSISNAELLIQNCPMPTQGELKKLLAINGYMLQQVGLDMLNLGRSMKNGDKKVQLALQALSASREAIKAAASVDVSDGK